MIRIQFGVLSFYSKPPLASDWDGDDWEQPEQRRSSFSAMSGIIKFLKLSNHIINIIEELALFYGFELDCINICPNEGPTVSPPRKLKERLALDIRQ